MAMAGSAIGLGNIWRFPYIVGQYGGSAFILLYIFCSFVLALPIFLSESVIGRATHRNTFGAMEALAPGTKWKWLSLLTIITPVIILSYYSVVGGWSIGYLAKSCAFQFTAGSSGEVTGMFSRFVASPWIPLACMTIFLGFCAVSWGWHYLDIFILRQPGREHPGFQQWHRFGRPGLRHDFRIRDNAGGLFGRHRAWLRPGSHFRDSSVYILQDGHFHERPHRHTFLHHHNRGRPFFGSLDDGGCRRLSG